MCRHQTKEDAVMNSHHEKGAALGIFLSVLKLDVRPKQCLKKGDAVNSHRDSRWKSLFWNSVLIIVAAMFMGIRPMCSYGPFEPTWEEYADPGSVYVPGGGFAGFWYHFGYFSYQNQQLKASRRNNSSPEMDYHRNDTTYYCYSSGCMAYVFAAANLDIDTVLSSAERAQRQWVEGKIHRYDVVPQFLQELLPPFSIKENQTISHYHASPWDSILSRLRILVTAVEGSRQWMHARVHNPTCHSTLIQHLQETTHLPWLTGPLLKYSKEEVIVDGGFSRHWHPPCHRDIRVPNTWLTVLHSFNPGMDPKHAKALFRHGMTDAASLSL